MGTAGAELDSHVQAAEAPSQRVRAAEGYMPDPDRWARHGSARAIGHFVTCNRLVRLAARLGGLGLLAQSYVGKRPK